jgi:hypothetical protein
MTDGVRIIICRKCGLEISPEVEPQDSKKGSAQEFVNVCNWRGFQNPGASGF